MAEKEYHHGNLKHALIEAGIQLMNESGEAGLSLRKLASICKVSVAAPYAHFHNKEDLIHGMQEYVTAQFMDELERAVAPHPFGSFEAILAIGEAYITFFMNHPLYFRFLFFTPYLTIHLSAKEPLDPYPPYGLFHKNAIAMFHSLNEPDDVILSKLTNMWGTVQGIAMLAASSNVIYDGSLKDDLHRIIRNC